MVNFIEGVFRIFYIVESNFVFKNWDCYFFFFFFFFEKKYVGQLEMLLFSMEWDNFEFNFHANEFLFYAFNDFLVYFCFTMMEEIISIQLFFNQCNKKKNYLFFEKK